MRPFNWESAAGTDDEVGQEIRRLSEHLVEQADKQQYINAVCIVAELNVIIIKALTAILRGPTDQRCYVLHVSDGYADRCQLKAGHVGLHQYRLDNGAQTR